MEVTKKSMPTVALRGVVVFPGRGVQFDIKRPRSVHAVQTALMEDTTVFLITQKNPDTEKPGFDELYQVGVVAKVETLTKMNENAIRVSAKGLYRATMLDLEVKAEGDETVEYLFAETEKLEAVIEDFTAPTAKEAMLRSVKETFYKYLLVGGRCDKEFSTSYEKETELATLMDNICNQLIMDYEKKQAIMEEQMLTRRYELVLRALFDELDIIAIRNEFHTKVKAAVDKNQKEYLLREQQKIIRKELGEENVESEVEEFTRKTAELQAPEEVKEKLKKEIARFKSISQTSSESAVIRGYIETLLELPWQQSTTDNQDLKHAEYVLDRDHYGLEKVKERMLEFLAVRNLTGAGSSPIVCLIGPPGCGKTSIARSVAEALGKEYVRICLGGVRDEAEIRGHRRTYVGAMPGRIIAGLKQAGANNPLLLLDEIDKVGQDRKGDTASALLEVLDSEQNSHFRDHYVELPVDLSNVLFFATANNVEDIPRPLLDRMEVIEVSSYTANEKVHIAREHLLEKQRKKNGLQKEQLTITKPAIEALIEGYTKEAGVRNLERKIGAICRKAARLIYEGKKEHIRVTPAALEQYLGKAKYKPEDVEKEDTVGLVHGLAWTSVGGTTLDVEVAVLPGKGELKLTGKLGDVMKESAEAAYTYVQGIASEYGVEPDFFKEQSIHVHIPEGAVPKDGPSAGITMTTAILSAVSNRAVKGTVAMTGEVTLRGRVLPIGGLKEKLLAAKNAGMTTIVVPKRNEKDVTELSEEIIGSMEIHYAEQMSDVLEVAFVGGN